MASPERPLGGESGRHRSGKHSSDRKQSSPAPARRGRSPARERAPPAGEDTSSTPQHLSKRRHHSPSPRQRAAKDDVKPQPSRRRSRSVASQRSTAYRPREVAGTGDSKSARKPHSPSNRHQRDSPPSRKRRRTRSPSPTRLSSRHTERRRGRSAERSPPRPRRTDLPPREVDRAYTRRSSRSRSPRPAPREVKYQDLRPLRRNSPSPPPRAADSYIPHKPRRRTPSPVYRDSRPSRRRSPSPERRPRDTYSRRSSPSGRLYKDTGRREPERLERRSPRERVRSPRRSPSPRPNPRRRSPSPDRRRLPSRDRNSAANRDPSPRRPHRTNKRSPSPRDRKAEEGSARRKRSRSRSYSPRRSSRRDSRDREMYPRQQNNYYGPPSNRPPPIDTRFAGSPQHGYPAHRGGYNGPSPHSSYQSSPNWSPQQSPYYPPSGNPGYTQQGAYQSQNSYLPGQQNYGPPHQGPPSATHSGSPTRGGRGGFSRGGMMNTTPTRPHHPGPAQGQNYQSGGPGQRTNFSNLTWKPGVGTRGGFAPINRLPLSSSAQASQAQSTSRDDGTAEPIDEDADDNPFRPAKELRAKEHKPVETPAKPNKESSEDRRTSQDNGLAKQDQSRRASESSPTETNMPPPDAPASLSSSGPKIGPFKLLKSSNASKATTAAAKPNVFQAKAPPAEASVDRRQPEPKPAPEPRPSPVEPPRSRYDDRRPYDRRSDPYMRDSYDRDNRYYSRDYRDQYDRRDYRPDPRYPRYERDRPPPREAREIDRVEPPRKPPPKPDVKVLVVKETKQIWREREGWKMFPKPTGIGPDGKVRWGKNKDLLRPPKPPPRAACPAEHQIPPASILPADLNVPGLSVYPRKGGRASVVGTGTYGQVYKSINVYKHEQGHVALKKINLQAEKNGFPFTAVREIRTLISIHNERVPRLLECMVEQHFPYMIFEYVPFDLAGLINHTTFNLTAAHKKDLAKQMYEGIIWLHTQGILHRDIKAANILVDKTGGLKLTDFGLCKTFDIKKGAKQEHTNRVVTIWYRAPELLLGEIHYGTEIDFWAAACVLVEILNGGNPIFPGPGSDIMQLDAMFWCLGKPTAELWPRLFDMPWWSFVLADQDIGGNLRATENSKYKRRFEDRYGKKLSPMALDLLQKAFRWDPDQRLDGEEVLRHAYFTGEEPAPARCVELEGLEGDFHEWDHKMKKRAEREEREKKEREKVKAKKAAKRAAEEGGEKTDVKRARLSGSQGQEEVKSDGVMDVDPPGAPADPASGGEHAEEEGEKMELSEKPSA